MRADPAQAAGAEKDRGESGSMNVSERVRSANELKQKKQKELQEIEDVAVELASLAGAEIMRTLGSIFTVRYKTEPRSACAIRCQKLTASSNRSSARASA